MARSSSPRTTSSTSTGYPAPSPSSAAASSASSTRRCSPRSASRSPSSKNGRLAACAAFGVDAGRMADHFPIGIYAVPEISMVGAPEHELTRSRIPYETGVARYREIARGQIVGDDSGLVKLLFHRETRRLLGVHAIGTGATELIHIGQAVL